MNKNKVAPLGFEPRPNGLEPLVLPLHHRANIAHRRGFELLPTVLETVMLPTTPAMRVSFIPEHHNHTWKRCCILAITELQPSWQESYFCIEVVIYVSMEPFRVSPCRKKHDSKSFMFSAFLHPSLNSPAIRWITEDIVVLPVLYQTIILYSEVSFAFMVFIRATWVQLEVEFLVKRVIQILRSLPFC